MALINVEPSDPSIEPQEAELQDAIVEPRDAADSIPLSSWRTRGSALLRLLRPRQWIKNALVFVAPGAAGVLVHPHAILLSLAAFVVFSLAASGTYAINDAMDADADRVHPTKRMRPIASGAVSVQTGIVVGSSLIALSVACAWWLAGPRFFAVVAVYLMLTSAYSIRLKHEPVVDLACVSAGFVLRAIGGGVAVGIPLSHWFLLVASFGALFVVTGKRSAESSALGDGGVSHRLTLASYPTAFLRAIRIMAGSLTTITYCLWAFDRSAHLARGHHPIWFELSVIPVVIGLLHIELLFETGHGAAPEELALHDRLLQVVAMAWIGCFALGVYG